MNTTQVRSRWRRTYDAWLGPTLVAISLAAVVVCSIAVSIEAHTNRVQDAQRLKDQKDRTAVIARVLSCVRDFAAELGDSLPPVRAASTKQNEALIEFLVGKHSLGQLVIDAQHGVQVDPKVELPLLVAATRELRRTNRGLVMARKNNPYPKIPASACQVGS